MTSLSLCFSLDWVFSLISSLYIFVSFFRTGLMHLHYPNVCTADLYSLDYHSLFVPQTPRSPPLPFGLSEFRSQALRHTNPSLFVFLVMTFPLLSSLLFLHCRGLGCLLHPDSSTKNHFFSWVIVYGCSNEAPKFIVTRTPPQTYFIYPGSGYVYHSYRISCRYQYTLLLSDIS